MTPSVDFAPATDAAGNSLLPGDSVSFKTYPRGTLHGTVIVHRRATELWEGVWLPTLAIETEDGTVYELISRGVRKLRRSARRNRVPHIADLSARNWGIRPATGDLVARDVGISNAEPEPEALPRLNGRQRRRARHGVTQIETAIRIVAERSNHPLRWRFCSEANAEHARSRRQFAHTLHVKGPVICFAKAAASLPLHNLVGLAAHELGHLVLAPKNPKHTEEAADAAGSEATGLDVRYGAACPGATCAVQTVGRGVGRERALRRYRTVVDAPADA